jgi:hypothetical protein
MALPATHGWYLGDGREGREIVVGFGPRLVVFTCPLYPEGYPEYVKGAFVGPGLHAQPEFTERGFLVSGPYNELGSGCMYIVWKDVPAAPGEPAPAPAAEAEAAPAAESPAARRRREREEEQARARAAREERRRG